MADLAPRRPERAVRLFGAGAAAGSRWTSTIRLRSLVTTSRKMAQKTLAQGCYQLRIDLGDGVAATGENGRLVVISLRK